MIFLKHKTLLAVLAAAAVFSAQAVFAADADHSQPLYAPNGDVYVYDAELEAYLCDGAPAPDGMPLYAKKNSGGRIYFTTQPKDRIDAQRINLWTNMSVLLGAAEVIELEPRQTEPAMPTAKAVPAYVSQSKVTALDISETVRKSLASLQAAVKKRGIESVFAALTQYCGEKRFEYTDSVVSGRCSFTYTADAAAGDIYTQGTVWNFAFDTNSKLCSVMVRVPNAKIEDTASGAFSQPAPSSLKAFGLQVTDTPYLVEGYTGYIVKEVRPWSPAYLAGFERFDQIIAVDGNSITASQPKQQLVKRIGKQLYSYNYPVSVTWMRKGIQYTTELRP